ncbi:hypothetical protein JB92DRAFT_2963366, partial [Gautieria morchelliformis]
NLSSKEIATAYQSVQDGTDRLDGSNDLKVPPLGWLWRVTNSKVQSQGSGGLEEVEEEFADGRCIIII